MNYALQLETTNDNVTRALILSIDTETNERQLVEVAEGEDAYLREWIASLPFAVEYVTGAIWQDFQKPDCLTLWETAEAVRLFERENHEQLFRRPRRP